MVLRRPKPIPRDEAAAELEVMLARIREMQDRELSPDLRDSYRAAAGRISATLYRLKQPKPTVIGLKKAPAALASSHDEPPKPSATRKIVPAPAPSQSMLPLGPVAVTAKPPSRKRR